jgi:hypothetical protein
MVNRVSSPSAVPEPASHQAVSHQKAAQPKPRQRSAAQPSDTVQLSSKAKAEASAEAKRSGGRQ